MAEDVVELDRLTASTRRRLPGIAGGAGRGLAPGMAGVEIWLDNFEDLAWAYDEALARQVFHHVRDRVGESLFLDAGRLVVWGRCLTVPFSSEFLSGAPSVEERQRCLEDILTGLMTGVDAVPQQARPLLSGRLLPDGGDDEARRAPEDLSPIRRTPQWAEECRRDMARVVVFLDGLIDGHSVPCWHPVSHAEDSGKVLFYELGVYDIDALGDGVQCDDVALAGALERTGFLCVLEHFLVSRAIRELEAFPNIAIGVKISCRSAQREAMWASLYALTVRPSLATRLIILLDAGDFACGAAHRQFASRIRQSGFRLALTRFGVAGDSLADLVSLRPDLVKVDGFFVRYALISPAGREILGHLVGMVSAVARHVVIDGVDTEDCAALGKAAGASWQRGHRYGCASVIRPWRKA